MSIPLAPILLLFGVAAAPATQSPAEGLAGQQGALTLAIDTPRAFRNGAPGNVEAQLLARIPGVAGCHFQRSYEAVYVQFSLAGSDRHDHGFLLALPELPGPERYYLQFTWDADAGLSDGYLNGTPLRFPGVRFEPWKVSGECDEVETGMGPCEVSVVELLPRYLPHEEMVQRVPQELRGSRKELFGLAKQPAPIDVDARRGELLYERELDDEEDIADWIVEGPGIVSFSDGAMTMRSETPRPPVRGDGHFNLWCPEDFPASFIAEWEFAPVEEHGCALFFFAAKGVEGADIFDPSLPARDGHYPDYTRGAVQNYHAVYFDHLPLQTTGRLTSSLVKCPDYCIVSRGPMAVPPGTQGFQRLRLVKDGARIQLTCNGRVALDFTDSARGRYGPSLGAGKMALRQMAITAGRYRNFRVWGLASK